MSISPERAQELLGAISSGLPINTNDTNTVFEVFSAFAKADSIAINERIDTALEIDDYFPEEGLAMDNAEHQVFTDSFFDYLSQKTPGIKRSLDCNSDAWLTDTSDKISKLIVRKMQIHISSDITNPGGVGEFLRQIDYKKYNAEVKKYLKESIDYMRLEIENHIVEAPAQLIEAASNDSLLDSTDNAANGSVNELDEDSSAVQRM